jgi:hypothetical protein
MSDDRCAQLKYDKSKPPGITSKRCCTLILDHVSMEEIVAIKEFLDKRRAEKPLGFLEDVES